MLIELTTQKCFVRCTSAHLNLPKMLYYNCLFIFGAFCASNGLLMYADNRTLVKMKESKMCMGHVVAHDRAPTCMPPR